MPWVEVQYSLQGHLLEEAQTEVVLLERNLVVLEVPFRHLQGHLEVALVLI